MARSIFNRISDVVKANINNLVDQAEDPEKMIKQMVIEMEEAISKATNSVGVAVANEKRLERQYKQNLTLAEEWQQKAVLAIQNSRDDLAKAALEKKNNYQRAADDLLPSYEQAKTTATQLREQLRELKKKLDDAKIKRDTLIARFRAAKAKEEISASVSGIGGDAFGGFDRFERKIEDKEAQADAAAEIAGESSSDSNLEKEFEALETSSVVDDELAALKASMNK
ncbi:MAG: PspA/IM30 family protein [Calditrichaeota bacterium]|nr:MAG: PspA/IM30 family protein [Calditrichota bacterium]